MPFPTQAELRRRLRAARHLAGFKSVPDLAKAIPPEAHIGVRKLYDLEGGNTTLTPPILREIAAACGLPYSFFTDDIAEAMTRRAQARDVEDLEQRLEDRLAAMQGQLDRLAELEGIAALAAAANHAAEVAAAEAGNDGRAPREPDSEEPATAKKREAP